MGFPALLFDFRGHGHSDPAPITLGYMEQFDVLHPDYGFARHKGYGTQAHRESLLAHGPCEQHRRSFAPVRMAG